MDQQNGALHQQNCSVHANGGAHPDELRAHREAEEEEKALQRHDNIPHISSDH